MTGRYESLIAKIRHWQADDRQGYDVAIGLLCEAVDELERLRAALDDLLAGWREQARRVRPLESAPPSAEKRARVAEWMHLTNRANELAHAMNAAKVAERRDGA